MNVLDLRGPEFLELYIGALIVAGLAGLALRWALSGPFSAPAPNPAPTDVFEIAYLAGGPAGLAHAVLASLVHRGLAVVKAGGGVFIDSGDRRDLHPVERGVVVAARQWRRPAPMPLSRFRSLVDGGTVGRALESAGLALPPGRRLLASAVPALGMGAVLALGVAKVGVGLSRGRPVTYLLVLCAVAGIAAVAFCRPVRRSVRGVRALGELRDANVSLHATARKSTTSLTAPDVALALALWGPAMLTGVEFSRLRGALASTGSGAGWLSGSGGGCGSGSGCGGGGCGGGCGGCGG